jgi:hypothetical protein
VNGLYDVLIPIGEEHDVHAEGLTLDAAEAIVDELAVDGITAEICESALHHDGNWAEIDDRTTTPAMSGIIAWRAA